MILLQLISLLSSGSNGADILLHPKSRLAPIGTQVTFHCKINNSMDPYWVVNKQAAHSAYQKNSLLDQGFLFEELEHEESVAVLTVRVKATADINGTELFCFSLPPPGIRSHSATLLILVDPLISPNPSVVNPTASSITLLWSPPFLWPGLSVEYYDVYVTDLLKRESSYYHVNTTFSDEVASFTTITSDPNNSMACINLHFSISAVVGEQEKLPSFTANGGYLPPTHLSSSLEVNTTVLFDAEMTVPQVVVEIKVLQVICSYQKINVTMIVRDHNGSTMLFGPYQHLGNNIIRHTISSNLEEESEYSLWANVELITGTLTSDKHNFDTRFHCHSSADDQPNGSGLSLTTFLYAIITTAIVLVMIFIIITLVTCAISWHRQAQAQSRVNSVMVENPIYEKPGEPQRQSHIMSLDTTGAGPSSIYSVVADERSVTNLKMCQKSFLNSKSNIPADEDDKYVTVLNLGRHA